MSRLWILGAADPEMEAIEAILRECGEAVAYAADDRGERLRLGDAYSGETIISDVGCYPDGITHVYLVECELLTPAIPYAPGEDICHPELAGRTVVRIDHHRLGDPGYGRPPADFLPASSLGQVIAELARLGRLPRAWATVPAALPEQRGEIRETLGDWVVCIAPARPGWDGYSIDDPYQAPVLAFVPHELVLTAAADHCLAHAYAGRCPGVSPDALMQWRAESRAAFQGRSVSDVLADVARACKALRAAPEVVLSRYRECPWHEAGNRVESDCLNADGTEYADECCMYAVARDIRGQHVPELPEASAREGICFISDGLPDPSGRVKVVCQSGSPEQIDAFMRVWGPRNGLVDIYGVPARGFAGGYMAARLTEDLEGGEW